MWALSFLTRIVPFLVFASNGIMIGNSENLSCKTRYDG